MKKHLHDDLARARELRARVRRALLTWYRKNARDLPWRRTSDPYAIWVSEILLQQTRVETAIAYYERFLSRFPSVESLARASLDDVMKAWEGAGYYSRAQRLHDAAKLISARGGAFPRTAGEWRKLPGVGPYTAAAIASITSKEKVPAIDGNAQRVLTRLFEITACIEETRTAGTLRKIAETLLAPKSPGDFNQAMMDLGATVCVPRNPHCKACPLRTLCAAFKSGRQEHLPARREKKPTPHYDVVAGVIRKNGRLLLGKRPAEGMLAGLWEFPGGKVEPGENDERALQRELKEELGVDVSVGELLATIRHAYSHFKITLRVYSCEILRGKPRPLHHEVLEWVPFQRIFQKAIPTATRRALEIFANPRHSFQRTKKT